MRIILPVLYFLCIVSDPLIAQDFRCHGNHLIPEQSETVVPTSNQTQVQKPLTAITYIPIVIHVLYNTAAQNIPDAQIYAQVDALNKDFARLNADTINTPPEFQAVAGAVPIQFCLVQQDSLGNPTTGITRHYTDTVMFMDSFLGNSQYFQTSTGGQEPWDPYHYLNIYVINRSYFAGTASSPSSHGAAWDGMAIQYTEFHQNSHVLTHEVGHYFGLFHIFGGTSGQGSCGDDMVADTPPQAYNLSCNYPVKSCGNTVSNDMVMNYMDYTPSSCKNMFTHGQADRMVSKLYSDRISLVNTPNCGSVGINSPSLNSVPIKLYPNPSSSSATLYMAQNLSGCILSLYSSLSKEVFRTTCQDQQITIPRNGLPSGLYYIRLMQNDQVLYTSKLIFE